MGTKLHICILLAGSVLAKEPELPLCPTNFQYLPQNLPMHCRMPVNGNPPPFPIFPGAAPGKPQENMQSVPVPPVPAFQKPPGFPPGPFPGIPPGYPMQPGMPMPMPMPMPIQMAGPPQSKLPVIVMPFYSPDPAFKGPTQNLRPNTPENHRPHKKKRERRKRRRPYKSDDSDTDADDTDDSSNSEADDGYWRPGRRTMNKRRRRKNSSRKQMLTPILQYVTKDGYVIYEKQISKGEATDWLGKGKGNEEDNPLQEPDAPKTQSAEDDYVPVTEVTTTSSSGPAKIQVKVQKNTDIQRHHRHKPKHNPE